MLKTNSKLMRIEHQFKFKTKAEAVKEANAIAKHIDRIAKRNCIPLARQTILGLTTKHKVFISCQENEKDFKYKKSFAELGKDVFIDKSVWKGDINPDNKDEYIKRLIQENHIEDTTVLIVLMQSIGIMGLNTLIY